MNYIEESKLEQLLKLAATEPAHRPEFYSVLLDSTVYILGDTGQAPEANGKIQLEAGSKLAIQHWQKQDGTPVIPFFSSLRVLQRSVDSEQTYVALTARSLFEITSGATLILNPKSEMGKEFLPGEIEALLSSGLSRTTVQRVVEQETNVILGQPAIYPSKLVDSLIQLFSKHEPVHRAFLALMHDPSIDSKPHLIVGIEAYGDIGLVMREAGNVAADTAPDNELVDLCRVRENEEGLSQYFIERTKPFYDRSWGAKLQGPSSASKSVH